MWMPIMMNSGEIIWFWTGNELPSIEAIEMVQDENGDWILP